MTSGVTSASGGLGDCAVVDVSVVVGGVVVSVVVDVVVVAVDVVVLTKL